MTNFKSILKASGLACLITLLAVGCTPSKTEESGTKSGETSSTPKGTDSARITIDGSSTVFPISEAIAEEFQRETKLEVQVSKSGTGGGFKKFAAGDTDISNASRPISPEEIELCAKGGIEFIELPVAFDGLSVVVNKANTWVDFLTVAELKKIWEPNSTVKTWADVRAGWPAKPIKLYGAGTDSGTYDYFTEAVCGKKGASRSDYQASEDDNTLVTGVKGDEGGLAYFGFAYYVENQADLKLVPIDGGKGPVAPSEATITDGTYSPLARPEFIYVKKSSADREEVKKFIEFHLGEKGQGLIKEAMSVPLPAKAYELALARFNAKKTGSLFSEGKHIGLKIEDILAKEQ